MTIVCATGARIPSRGLGTDGMRGKALAGIVAAAVRAGFRHIDTEGLSEPSHFGPST
ncbi:2,5-didehydrogluconate reductase [Ralstonia solanacearum]|uniref:2,5-didehydrogluconate reductase n=1 Tax=Ralstonia solanacearum TaxID=305 RepID=A0AAD0WIA8_RALSL